MPSAVSLPNHTFTGQALSSMQLTSTVHILSPENQKGLIFFLFLHDNICCGYSIEAPRHGASNKNPQHMFSCRNKKIIWDYPLFSGTMETSAKELGMWPW